MFQESGAGRTRWFIKLHANRVHRRDGLMLKQLYMFGLGGIGRQFSSSPAESASQPRCQSP
jgi:hypothetical protein